MIGTTPFADLSPVVVTGSIVRPTAPNAFTYGGSVWMTAWTSGRLALDPQVDVHVRGRFAAPSYPTATARDENGVARSP